MSPLDLSFLNGRSSVEASVFFPDFVGPISFRYANLCASVTSPREAVARATPKVLFCDLDGTVWTGTVGETPVTLIAAAADALRRLRSKRVQVVALTRAYADDARHELVAQGIDGLFAEVLSVRPHETKSSYISNWLSRHGCGPDESIFADNDGAERHEVRQSLSPITVIDERVLCHATLHPPISGRTGRASSSRPSATSPPVGHARHDTVSPRVKVEKTRSEDYARCWELLMRTNRYNCIEWQPSYAAFVAVGSHNNVRVLTGVCGDGHEDYGVCCLAVIEGETHLKALTFSCRVGHREFPSLFLDQLIPLLGDPASSPAVSWGAPPRPRADPVVWRWRRAVEERRRSTTTTNPGPSATAPDRIRSR